MEKRLYRSRDDRLIFGVCGGIAKYFNIDPAIVRIIAVLLVFAGGAAILAYIILAIVVPLESSQVSEPRDVIRENVEEIRQRATELGEDIRSTLEKKGAPEEMANRQRSRNLLGIILIIVGIIFLLATFRLFWWLRWVYLWPIILVAIGLLIIFGSRRK